MCPDDVEYSETLSNFENYAIFFVWAKITYILNYCYVVPKTIVCVRSCWTLLCDCVILQSHKCPLHIYVYCVIV